MFKFVHSLCFILIGCFCIGNMLSAAKRKNPPQELCSSSKKLCLNPTILTQNVLPQNRDNNLSGNTEENNGELVCPLSFCGSSFTAPSERRRKAILTQHFGAHFRACSCNHPKIPREESVGSRHGLMKLLKSKLKLDSRTINNNGLIQENEENQTYADFLVKYATEKNPNDPSYKINIPNTKLITGGNRKQRKAKNLKYFPEVVNTIKNREDYKNFMNSGNKSSTPVNDVPSTQDIVSSLSPVVQATQTSSSTGKRSSDKMSIRFLLNEE